MSSSSYSPPSKSLFPRISSNRSSKSSRPKKDARETSLIMDESYLPYEPKATLRRDLQYGKAALMDASGQLHDIDYRPFPPIYRPECRPSARRAKTALAYWETFKPLVEEYDSEDDSDTPANEVRNNHKRPSNYEPVWSNAIEGWRSEPNVAEQGTIMEDHSQTKESNKDDSYQRRRCQSMSTKEKVHQTWVTTRFRLHIRAIRAQRWLKECLERPDSGSASI